MLSTALCFAALGFVFLIAAPAQSVASSDTPKINQQKRIAQGVRSGEITRHELMQLKKEQRHIRQFARRAHADGHFDRWERHNLKDMRQRASKHIYRAKHNRQAYHGCRMPSGAPRYGHVPSAYPHRHHNHGAFSGSLVQPGLSMAWNIGLH